MSVGSKQLKKKICMLGTYGVGKTSLVRHFVQSIFDDSYLSTIGVKIDRKTVHLGEVEVTMVLWDIAGEEDFFQIPTSYVKGAAGYLLVVDGTRPETLQVALDVKERMDREVGELPFLILFNKADLTEEWKVAEEDTRALEEKQFHWFSTSAKSGMNVEAAFVELAKRMI